MRPPDDALWVCRVSFPAVMGELSKNRMNTVLKRGQGPNAKGQIVKTSSYLKAKARLALAVQGALQDVKRGLLIPEDEHMILEKKLWIAILLEKAQPAIDAANVVDIVCDAVQDATGLNDSWYSLGCVDWVMNTRNPYMHLTLWQERNDG